MTDDWFVEIGFMSHEDAMKYVANRINSFKAKGITVMSIKKRGVTNGD